VLMNPLCTMHHLIAVLFWFRSFFGDNNLYSGTGNRTPNGGKGAHYDTFSLCRDVKVFILSLLTKRARLSKDSPENLELSLFH